jgi:hypothetical protein
MYIYNAQDFCIRMNWTVLLKFSMYIYMLFIYVLILITSLGKTLITEKNLVTEKKAVLKKKEETNAKEKKIADEKKVPYVHMHIYMCIYNTVF